MAKDKTDPSTRTRMISILGHIRFSGEPFTLKIINKILKQRLFVWSSVLALPMVAVVLTF